MKIKLTELKVGDTCWSKTNPVFIPWVLVSVGSSPDGDLVYTFRNAGTKTKRASIENGDRMKLYAVEVIDYLTDNFFKSAHYKSLK